MKSFGYFISIVSVLLLGAAAWPKSGDPPEIMWLVIAGIAASIAGIFLRYLAYRKEQQGRTDA